MRAGQMVLLLAGCKPATERPAYVTGYSCTPVLPGLRPWCARRELIRFLPYHMAYSGVRTTLDLDDDLIRALLSRHPGLSKTEAIEMAIRVYLRESAVEGLRRRAGTMDIEDLSGDLRQQDRHS